MKLWITKKSIALSILATSFSSFSIAHAQDSLFITDGLGDKVVRFDYATGTAFDHFVGPGLSDLDTSVFMCLSTVGKLVFVASSTNDQIMAYDMTTGERFNSGTDDGVFIVDPTNLEHPTGLAASDKNDSLYVSSSDKGTILEYNGSTGAYIGILDSTLAYPLGLVITEDGERLYAVDFLAAGKVCYYDWDSMTSQYVYGGDIDFTGLDFQWPTGLAADSSDNIYVSQRGTAPGHTTGTVLKITPAGVASVFAAGPFKRIRDVAIDESDNLVVAHLDGISVFNSAGVDQSYAFTSLAGGLTEHNGLLLLDSAIRCDDNTECLPDLNNDGVLNFFDVSLFLSSFTAGCN